jgi:hypothetical protein
MTFECRKPGPPRPRWRGNTALRASATGTTGSEGNASWKGRLMKYCNQEMEQTYPGRKDEEVHFNAVLQAFSDKRYITIEGKPVFHIYKPHELPNAAGFVDHWRELAVKSGLKGIYFIGEFTSLAWDPVRDGFDAAVPNNPGLCVRNFVLHNPINVIEEGARHIREKLEKRPYIYSYKDVIRHAYLESKAGYDLYPSIVPNWDNTPRCGSRGYVLVDSTPELFRMHLREAINRVSDNEADKRIIFVKSWNEWAEGNHLEPDLKFGKSYLEVCRDEVFL